MIYNKIRNTSRNKKQLDVKNLVQKSHNLILTNQDCSIERTIEF